MRPLTIDAPKAAKQFSEGGYYHLEPVEERSTETHNHYFACIAEAFANLPEFYADRFATSEHLRKWCLIKRGFRNERIMVASSHRQANEIANLANTLDEFAVVHVRGKLVTIYTAKTQRMKRGNRDGMDKHEFQASKQAVLDECAALIGVSPDELSQPRCPLPQERRARQLEDA